MLRHVNAFCVPVHSHPVYIKPLPLTGSRLDQFLVLTQLIYIPDSTFFGL